MRFTTYTMAIKGTSKEHRLHVKQKVVRYVQVHGIKPAVRKFGMDRNTIRGWFRSYELEGIRGLLDKRKGPNQIKHKTTDSVEAQIISIRKRTGYGPRRIKYFFDVKCGYSAIQRILSQNKLTRRRRKLYQKKRDLRAVKAKYQALTHIQYDVKHLRDIPNYWLYMQEFDLPKYQYTARDVRTGWVFLGYSNELSELNARTMIHYIIDNLKHSVPLTPNQIHIQTDNGAEFSGAGKRVKTASFVRAILEDMGANHAYIPPGCCNANADVESFHNTIEVEFLDFVDISSREDFFRKAETYRIWYNLKRPNFSKGVKTPLEIIEEYYPKERDHAKLACISTIDLDKIANYCPNNSRGESFPNHPDFAQNF